MAEHFANNATTQLSGAINNSTPAITVVSGAAFPAQAPFTIFVEAEGTNTAEMMLVTNGAGTTNWTVTRATNGTAPSAHGSTAVVRQDLAKSGVDSLGDGYWSFLRPAGLTGAIQQSRYVGATASGAPASGSFQAGDFIVDRTGGIWVCTVAGTPGVWATTQANTYSAASFSSTSITGDGQTHGIPLTAANDPNNWVSGNAIHVPMNGTYLISGKVQNANQTTVNFGVGVTRNGTQPIEFGFTSTAEAFRVIAGSEPLALTAGDAIGLYAKAGTTVTVSGGTGASPAVGVNLSAVLLS